MSIRVPLGSVLALAAAIGFAGCAEETPQPQGSGLTATTTTTVSTPAPTPAPTDEASVATTVLPTDCATLGTEPTRQETIGDLTLQSNGEDFVRPAPVGATLALGCDWIVGDSTGMLLLISTAEASAVTTAVQGLSADGYSCQASVDFAAQFCQRPGTSADTEEMIVARDTVWIYLSTSNRNGRALFSEIVEGIFG